MGKLLINVPRLRSISGRYFWRPTPAVKALGFAAEALGADLDAAIAKARRLNDAVDEAIRTGGKVSIVPNSVGHLIQIYEASPAYAKLAASTRVEYAMGLRRIETTAARFLVARIDRKGLVETYDKLIKAHGLISANNLMKLWRILLGVAYDRGWRKDNPASKMHMTSGDARTAVWTPDQVDTVCRAATAAGRPSIALAIRLAYDIGQRQGDVLRLTASAWNGTSIRVRQGKTGSTVIVPVAPETRALIDGRKKTDSTQLIVTEHGGKPYASHHFRHEFAAIREAAGLPDNLQFRDLRRSAATELGAAGATDDEIRAVTGHRSREVVKVYVVPDDRMAKAAQAKRHRNKG